MVWSFLIVLVPALLGACVFACKQKNKNRRDNISATSRQKKVKEKKPVHLFVGYTLTSPASDKYDTAGAKTEIAFLRYRNLEALRDAGMITDKEYDAELDRILPYIDISRDIAELQKG